MPEWKMAAKQSEIWFNCIKSLLPACNILQNSTCFQVWIHSWLKIVLLGTFTHCFTFVHLQCCNLKRFFSHFSLLLIRDSLCSSLHSSIPFYWLWGPLDSVLVPEGQVEIQRGSLLVCNKCFHEGAHWTAMHNWIPTSSMLLLIVTSELPLEKRKKYIPLGINQ